MINIRGADTEPWGMPLLIAKGRTLKVFHQTKFFSVFSTFSLNAPKLKMVISFFVSPFLNVDQHEASKKKKKIPPAAKDTHPDRVGPTSAGERREFFGGSASEWEGRDDQLVSPQGTWCRRVSEEATKR